jgi:Methylmalonyl Co-A mutase-associated GTPase MeaB
VAANTPARRSFAEPAAVLVTGVYGAGKSTVVADIGALLESRGERYGVLDVDWLGWFDAGAGPQVNERVTLSNVRAVCGAYLEVGVRRLALAWAVGNQAQLEATRQAVGVPMAVVRLQVDSSVVRGRLAHDPTQERREDDLRVALEWLREDRGVGLEDLLLPGTPPVRQTSQAICSWLGWL